MDSSYFIASAYALLFLRAARLPAGQVLEGTGLTEEALLRQDYIPSADLARILRNMEGAGLPAGWAARTGSQLSINTHGPLGFAALSAPTLGAALQVMADYHGVRVNSITAQLQLTDNRCRFAVTDLTGDDQFGLWLSEAMLKVLQSLVETIVGHPAGDKVTISFAYPAPDYVEVLEDIYLAHCVFDAPQTAIAIPASWQHIPSPLYDEATYRSNIAKCREIISAQTRSVDPVQQVRNLLANYFDLAAAGSIEPQPPPGLQHMAETLHVTPRTLIRRLKQRNTSYRALLEQARKQGAEQLLQQAQLSVADVAHRLGYREAANFGRAFRTWYGCSPALWRRGQGEEPVGSAISS